MIDLFYIQKVFIFNQYFKEKKKTVKALVPSCFEAKTGEQSQIDWKENMPFVLKMVKQLLLIFWAVLCLIQDLEFVDFHQQKFKMYYFIFQMKYSEL